MEKLNESGRIFYWIVMAFVGFQQYFYDRFSLIQTPAWSIYPAGINIISFVASTALIVAGIAYVAPMVPDCISNHLFRTLFAAVVLIMDGAVIITLIWFKWATIVLGIMIFIWFLSPHITGSTEQPSVDRGIHITNALSALAFSGITFVIASRYRVSTGFSGRWLANKLTTSSKQ